MRQDIRASWRFLMKRKAASVIAVLTLGVAVAVCTLAVGVVDQAFWRPATADRGGDLLTIYNRRVAPPVFQTLSYPDYESLRGRLQDDVDLAAFVRIANTLGGGTSPARVGGELVSDNYFTVLGARPFTGRLLTPLDRGAIAGVVLGYDLWTRRLGGDVTIIGRPIRLGQHDYTVIGITAPGFRGPAYRSDFWLPIAASRQVFGQDLLPRPDVPLFQTVARPRRGVTLAQVQGRVQFVTTYASRDDWRLTAFPGLYLKFWPAYRPALTRFLSIFAALAACILVVACANLAGLLLARSGERRRELALRQALGATPRHILRRLAAESLLLALPGGAAGLLLAYWGAALVERVPVPVAASIGVVFDVRLGVICAAVSLVAAVFFTAMSAGRGRESSMRAMLSASAPVTLTSNRGHAALVVAQVALSCMLLAAAGLLARSAANVYRIDVGFDPTHRVVGTIALSDQGYSSATGLAFYQRLQESLASLPLVERVAFGWNAPLAPVRSTGRFLLPGDVPLQARYNVVGPGYFRTLAIDLRGGREFERTDRPTGEPVAIVNETLAARFPGGAVSQSLKAANESSPRRIVGVVRDVAYNGITEPSQPFVYLPLAQAFRADMQVYVQASAADPLALIRDAVQTLDPHVAVSDVRTMTAQLAEARAVPRSSAMASGAAALVAVALALMGVYGVLTTSVERRRRELAIRAAIGARPWQIVRLVLVEGAVLTTLGLALGSIGSVAAGRLLGDLLYGVAPRDAGILAATPLAVLAASALAWLGPARQAAAADPITLLRSE